METIKFRSWSKKYCECSECGDIIPPEEIHIHNLEYHHLSVKGCTCLGCFDFGILGEEYATPKYQYDIPKHIEYLYNEELNF